MLAVAGAVTGLSACKSGPRQDRLVAPRALQAPYDASKGEVLWAVIPLRNESGTTIVDELVVTDKLIGAIEEVRGLRCLPLDRTLAAMETLELRSVRTPGEARQLAQALGADAVVAGNITAYDPYTPIMGHDKLPKAIGNFDLFATRQIAQLQFIIFARSFNHDGRVTMSNGLVVASFSFVFGQYLTFELLATNVNGDVKECGIVR